MGYTEFDIQNIVSELIKFSEYGKIEQSSYLISYPVFVDFFSKEEELLEKDLIIGIHFTYGWMPTILEFKTDKFKEAVTILNKVKTDKNLETLEYDLLKGLFNNSIVGTSKLLHFINPKKYAIWDSRVCKCINKYTSLQLKPNKVADYEKYLELLNRIEQSLALRNSDFHKNTNKQIGYEVTVYRAIELVLFIQDKKESSNQRSTWDIQN